ncbi:unnamed protein product [Ceratitis capitata]|uniref:(Mediterranean fruit fly) hypothetical protein n=1 Tax=Ceratitis capitata TaxID=7213 RepID=A0A811UZH4_CERCA|nr:unnamed protein product [Ceratitis capitata]
MLKLETATEITQVISERQQPKFQHTNRHKPDSHSPPSPGSVTRNFTKPIGPIWLSFSRPIFTIYKLFWRYIANKKQEANMNNWNRQSIATEAEIPLLKSNHAAGSPAELFKALEHIYTT